MKRILLLLLIFNFQLSIFNFASAQRTNQAYWDYIENYHEMAQEQMRLHGIPASITLAQGLLESGAGRSTLATQANNHFGIKVSSGWTGPYMVKSDDRPDDRFRKYRNARESYEDHSQFLLKPRYASLFKLSPTDYKGWAKGLKSCGYATSPTYAQQLITIIENYKLYEYDDASKKHHHSHSDHQAQHGWQAAVAQANTAQPTSRSQAEQLFYAAHPVQQNNRNYYIVVQSGDNMPTLAMMTGISRRKIRRYNDLPRKYQPQAGDVLYLQKKRTHADKAYKGIPHVVQEGESMYSISQRYGIRLKSLYKLNDLPKDYMPQPGHMLRVY